MSVAEEIVAAIRRVARFEWSVVTTVDPETMLPSGGAVEGLPAEAWERYWDNELSDPDFNKFTELTRRFDPVATLFDAVDGVLERSPRYVKLYAALGAADELRVAFTGGSSCYATGSFVRPGCLGPFGRDEIAAVGALVPAATAAIRASLGHHRDCSGRLPVTVIMDADGTVLTATHDADQVLEDLRVSGQGGDADVVSVAVRKARANRARSLSTRLRGHSGCWYRLHVVSMIHDASVAAVTIEPARPDDLAQVLLSSYGLTERETQIVAWLCRGLSAKEIAAELIISAHTVRDHIKGIYQKAGVSSRGELVASLFRTHLLDSPSPTPAVAGLASWRSPRRFLPQPG